MTATLTLTGDQIISLFAQLEPQTKRSVLYLLAETAGRQRAARMATVEASLRRRATSQSLDWDTMTEQERLDFVDDLVHEDR
jgi:hypothetical protein